MLESRCIEVCIRDYCNEVIKRLDKDIKYKVIRKLYSIDILFCNKNDITFTLKINLNKQDLPSIDSVTKYLKHYLDK